MSRESWDNENRNNDAGESKRWQSSQTEAAFIDQNTGESDPIHEFDDDPLAKTEKTAFKSCVTSCAKGRKNKKTKPSHARSGCSRHCTGFKRDADNESFQMTVCTTRKRDKLDQRMKRSKKKLQQISDQVKKRTKLSVKRIKKMYENLGAKRATGFKCNLKNCESTLLDCSASECVKPNMLFGTFHKMKDKIKSDKEDTHYTICHSKSSRVGTKNNNLKVLKEKSTETNVDEETSM